MKLIYRTKNNKLREIDLSAPFWRLLAAAIILIFMTVLVSVMFYKTLDTGLENYYNERQYIVEYYDQFDL